MGQETAPHEWHAEHRMLGRAERQYPAHKLVQEPLPRIHTKITLGPREQRLAKAYPKDYKQFRGK